MDFEVFHNPIGAFAERRIITMKVNEILGRKLLIVALSIVICMDIITDILYIIRFEISISMVIRFLVTLFLCYLIAKGIKWAYYCVYILIILTEVLEFIYILNGKGTYILGVWGLIYFISIVIFSIPEVKKVAFNGDIFK